jgi:HEAT repeat protein
MRNLGIALALALLAAWPADALARGGTYRGPNGAVPPAMREPTDPTPPPPPPPVGPPIGQPPTPPPPRPLPQVNVPPSALSFAEWRFWYHHNQELFETRAPAGLALAQDGALTASQILPTILWCLDAKGTASIHLRGAAYTALGKIANTPELVERIRQGVREERDLHARESAIIALGLLRRTEAKRQLAPSVLDGVRAELLALLRNEKLQARSRAFAAAALGLLGDQSTRTPVGAKALTTKLFTLLEHKHHHPDVPLSILLAVSLQPRDSITQAQREAVHAIVRTGEIGGRKRHIGRAHAAIALGRMGTEADTQILLDALQDIHDKSHGCGRAAAIALGTLVSRLSAATRSSILQQMITLLEPDRNESKPDAPKLVPILDPTQRGLLLIAMARIAAADLSDVEGLTGRIGSAGQYAKRRLTAGTHVERAYAGLALGLLGSGMRPSSNAERQLYRRRTTLLLFEMLEDGKSLAPRHRAAFALAIGLMGSTNAHPPLLALLNDKKQDPDLRGACARALALLGAGGDDVRSGLVQTLTNRRSEALGIDCAAALGQLGGPAAGPALLAYLQTIRSYQGKGTAAAALGGIGAKAEVAALVKIVKDAKQHAMLRSMAVAALGRIGDPEAIPSLVRITGHMNWRASTDFLNEICSLL